MTGGTLSAPVILIVEDDELQKLLAVEIVEEAGFVAIAACDADEAIAILESRSDIVFLLTDIDMPGSMDGLKRSVRSRWPPIKIIVVSGGALASALPADVRFFAKPYRTDAMISEIRSLIAG